MCLTNPIWTAPYKIQVEKPAACPIPPKQLSVKVKFGISMMPTLKACGPPDCAVRFDSHENPYTGAQILVKPLDKNGQSGTTTFTLSAERRWSSTNLPGQGEVANAEFSATNADEIPCDPDSDWDAITHKASTGSRSYAVVVTDLRDMHGNPLNAVADTFTTQGAITGPGKEMPKGNEGNSKEEAIQKAYQIQR